MCPAIITADLSSSFCVFLCSKLLLGLASSFTVFHLFPLLYNGLHDPGGCEDEMCARATFLA